MRNGRAVLPAEELRLEAFVAEALGVRAPEELVALILDCLRARPRSQSRPRWLGTLLVAAGIAVATSVAWLERGSRGAPAAVTAPASPQEPQTPQQPQPDARLQKEVERLVRDLELPARRGPAIAALQQLGTGVLPLLRTALAGEEKRGRAEVIGVLQQAIMLVDLTQAKAAFGLPPGDVTVISDYSENRVVFVDAAGKEVHALENVLGPWDASLTPQGTLLLTEFSISRVREVDRTGRTVWQFENLKSPYAASRLANGNTLIADTFNGRVIEVDRKQQIVWKYDKQIRPFACERLPDGNTLIADIFQDRVLEVNSAGETVWEVKHMNNVHDADRLQSGNTLVTLRASSRVVELDPSGKVVWELRDLVSPSDAERLPNGNTLVAEHGQVREFDAKGNQVWRKEMSWAVRAHRY